MNQTIIQATWQVDIDKHGNTYHLEVLGYKNKPDQMYFGEIRDKKGNVFSSTLAGKQADATAWLKEYLDYYNSIKRNYRD